VNSTYECEECNSVLFGCQHCINSTSCLLCSTNYFLNSSSLVCQVCTDVVGCQVCQNETTCLLCQDQYHLDSSTATCLLCSDSLEGCHSCVSQTVCIRCHNGYILDTDVYECVINEIEQKEEVDELKLITYYVSSSILKHVLFARGMDFISF
jgi:hypothetical protein